MQTCTMRASVPGDLAVVQALLEQARLPTDGLAELLGPACCVAEVAGEVVGAAALELYGDVGLLRSVVVSPTHRGSSIGSRLVGERVAWARTRRLERIYLLTLDAAGFFERLGFHALPRAGAPDAIRRSPEFTTLCPRSAVLMTRAP